MIIKKLLDANGDAFWIELVGAGTQDDPGHIKSASFGVLTTIDGHMGSLETSLGAPGDAEASTDTGTFSLIALFKHALTKLTLLVTNAIPSTTSYHGIPDITTTPAAIGAPQACRWIILQAARANTDTVTVGDAAGQIIELDPGQPTSVPFSNISTIWAKSASGTQVLNWWAGN